MTASKLRLRLTGWMALAIVLSCSTPKAGKGDGDAEADAEVDAEADAENLQELDVEVQLDAADGADGPSDTDDGDETSEILPWIVPPHDLASAPPPLIYIMNDWENCDPRTFTSKYGGQCWEALVPPDELPEGDYPLGYFGSHIRPVWSRLHTGPSTFDWEQLDTDLDRACSQEVLLPDGTVIPKPVLLSVAIYSGTCIEGSYCDHTPEWVGSHPTIGFGSTCSPVNIPAYDDPGWRNAYMTFVEALGARYNDHPCLGGYLIAAGFDDETAPTKDAGDCLYLQTFDSDGRWDSYMDFVSEAIQTASRAFPDKTSFIQNAACTTSHNCRNGSSEEAELNHVGIKLNGLQPPSVSYCWYHSMSPWGLMEIMDIYDEKVPEVPLGVEPKGVFESLDGTYWMFLAALAHHADQIDVQNSHFAALEGLPDTQGFKFFVHNYLHRDPDDAPGVWTVLREHTDFSDTVDYAVCPEHGPADDPDYYGCYPNDVIESDWPDCWSSDFYGDLRFFLYRSEQAGCRTRVVEPEELPAAARAQPYGAFQVRATDEAGGCTRISFKIDPRWWGRSKHIFRLFITYLDGGTDALSFVYADDHGETRVRTVDKTGTDEFRVWAFEIDDADFSGTLDDGADFFLDSEGDGDEYIHMVRVETTWALH